MLIGFCFQLIGGSLFKSLHLHFAYRNFGGSFKPHFMFCCLIENFMCSIDGVVKLGKIHSYTKVMLQEQLNMNSQFIRTIMSSLIL